MRCEKNLGWRARPGIWDMDSRADRNFDRSDEEEEEEEEDEDEDEDEDARRKKAEARALQVWREWENLGC
jgi:hypothetical protein